ncbi:MAG: transcription antitermination factor NusB [Acidobacteria bacterium]|nr:transcription antitermination factor NusB [Acidobacteriota bacterium]
MTDPHAPRWQGRRRAREGALQILYQVEVGQLGVGDASMLRAMVGAPDDTFDLDDASQAYADALARGALEQRADLDARLADAARNWRVERMAVVDRLVLRLALHELMAHPSTPPRVVIDEAIELARRYSGDQAARFVNGVLDGVFKKLRDEGAIVE